MKKLLLVISCCLLVNSPVYPETITSERILDLDECIRLVLLNNESLILLKKEYEIAQQRVRETNALFYPHLDFDFNYFRYQVMGDENKKVGIPYSYVFLPYSGITAQDYFATRLSLTQNLYSGGRITSARKLSQVNLKGVEIQTERRKNETIYQTKKTFYDCLLSGEKKRFYENSVNLLEQIHKDLSNQRISPEEERRISFHRNRLRSNLAVADYEFEKTKLNLLDLIGLELNTGLTLKGELKVTPEELNLDKCLAWAYQYRPELKQIQVEEEIDTLSVNLALAERSPTVSLGVNYLFVGPIFPYPEKNWSATVGISLPLFDGWAGWSRIRQSQAHLEQNKLKRVEWEDQINLEIRQVYSDNIFWRKELANWAKEEEEEKKYFELQKTKWATREIKLEQLIEELENLVLVKEKYLETLHQSLLVQIQLEKIVGKSFGEK